MIATLVLLLRLDVAIASCLAALAIGHHPSILEPSAQQRWRFTSGRIFPTGLIQMVAMVAIGMAVAQSAAWILVAAVGLWNDLGQKNDKEA